MPPLVVVVSYPLRIRGDTKYTHPTVHRRETHQLSLRTDAPRKLSSHRDKSRNASSVQLLRRPGWFYVVFHRLRARGCKPIRKQGRHRCRSKPVTGLWLALLGCLVRRTRLLLGVSLVTPASPSGGPIQGSGRLKVARRRPVLAVNTWFPGQREAVQKQKLGPL
jgi:hypothetical protein